MAYEVVIPRLGLTMEEARIVDWFKEDGEAIEAGEMMFSIETDKTVLEVEAPFSGTFYRITDLPDGPLPIGYLVGYIIEPGEAIPDLTPVSLDAIDNSTSEGERQEVPSITSLQSAEDNGRKLSSPAARRRAAELGVDWTTIERPSGGPILLVHVEQEAHRVTSNQPAANISPVAQRMAEAMNVDLAALAELKSEGKIMRADVEAYVSSLATAAPLPSKGPKFEPGQVVPVSRVRHLIAQRMSESSHTTAPVTLTTEADATELVNLRVKAKVELTPRGIIVPSYNALLVKLISIALHEHPGLNATLTDNEIIYHEDTHIGLAVDTDGGLIVPVIHNVTIKTIEQITLEATALAEQARNNRLIPDQLSGGTFTLTNLGMFNIDAFTPIINLPEAAILGVGRIVKRPVVYNEEIVSRDMMALSLTFDHRVVDGGPAARFLDTVRDYITHPYLWLTR